MILPYLPTSELEGDAQIDSSDPSPPLALAYVSRTSSSPPPTCTLRSQHNFAKDSPTKKCGGFNEPNATTARETCLEAQNKAYVWVGFASVHLLVQSDFTIHQLMHLLRIECGLARAGSCMRSEACNGISDQQKLPVKEGVPR